MRYFVLAPDGERYGPADIPTLNEWAASNRLFGSSKLVEEMSGALVTASSVQGLVFGPAPSAAGPMQPRAPMQPPAPGAPMQPIQPVAPGAGYARPGQAYSATITDDGKKDLLMAFGIAVGAPILSLILTWGIVFAAAGVQLSWKAMKKGQKLGMLALILNVIAIPVAIYMRFGLRYQFLGNY
jgi:hypothetical protein